MAKPINRKCSECARLPIDAARQNDCWTDERGLCHKRRSHYLRRGDRNLIRRIQYGENRQTSQSEPFTVSTQPSASLILVLYTDKPAKFKLGETPVHAIGAELWVGTEIKEQMVPVLCYGRRGDQVTEIARQALEEFSKRFAETYNQGKPFHKFETKVLRHILECPVNNPFQSQKSLSS